MQHVYSQKSSEDGKGFVKRKDSCYCWWLEAFLLTGEGSLLWDIKKKNWVFSNPASQITLCGNCKDHLCDETMLPSGVCFPAHLHLSRHASSWDCQWRSYIRLHEYCAFLSKAPWSQSLFFFASWTYTLDQCFLLILPYIVLCFFFVLSRHLWICAVSLPVRTKARVSKVEPRLDVTVLLAGLALTATCPMSPVKWQLHKGVNKHS